MAQNERIKISKFLSYVLRHRPESIGLTLDQHGWVNVDDLISCAAKHGKTFTRVMLEEVVQHDDKQRYTFSEEGSMIRANQGHSVEVDIQLESAEPPQTLYHGTAKRFLPFILKEGLQAMNRHHVHLSRDESTAVSVGKRYGEPVILIVDSQRMYKEGHTFYVSKNEVWLTEHVPVKYFEESIK